MGSPAPTTQECASRTTAFADTPLRRLTRSQYARSIGDLLSLPGTESDGLPDDERVGPFPANATQPVSDVHVRRFMEAAEALAVQATSNLDALLGCAPSDACAEAFIRRFAERAFRLPVPDAETNQLLTLYSGERARSSIKDGVQLVIEAVLQSPRFLYHIENKSLASQQKATIPLSPHEMASRLSYFLWNGPPDDPLRAAARDGSLQTADGVRAQAERLLSDDRAQNFTRQFGLHWFDLSSIERLTKDPRQFLWFSEAARKAMQDEAALFFDYGLRHGTLQSLLTAPYSFVSQPLLPIYGLASSPTLDPTKPTALDPKQRAGALTLPGFLATHAGPQQTSPVKRGVFVFKNLLCQSIALPNIEIPPLPEPKPNQTNRERFAVHTSTPACAVCHLQIDPLGFGFENYDAIGSYRATDEGRAVDAKGILNIGNPAVDGPFDGAVELSQKLLASDELHACVPLQLLRFALGRSETDEDACGLAELTREFETSGFDMRELVIALATSDAFRFRPASSSKGGK